MNNALFYFENQIDFSEPLILCEGVFDAMVAGNAIPLLGSSLRDSSKLLQEIIKHDTPIYLAMDPDAKEKEQKIAKLLIFHFGLRKSPILRFCFNLGVGQFSISDIAKRQY